MFGLGGTSQIDFSHKKTDTTDLFADPTKDSYFTSNIGLVGMKHFIRINEKSYVNTVIGATYAASNYDEDTISTSDEAARVLENKVTQTRYSINSSLNTKINSRWFIKAGIIEEIINLNLFYRSRQYTPNWLQIWDYNDFTSLVQAYVHSKYSITSKMVLNAGIHTQYLTLNGSKSVEPRLGLKYQVNRKNTISIGYGMHSQMQPTDVYFYRTQLQDGSYIRSNKDLDFTRSQHFVLGYDILPFQDWRIKTEVYYQLLSNVPVTIAPSGFSMLNNGASFSPNEEGYLQNTGTGTNYGAELTIEKFYSKGYYGLFTGTIYQSKYKGSDKIEHNTAFNGRYVYNILVGKEFKFGANKTNAFTMDLKFTKAGGRYYTPVDLAASQLAGKQVLQSDSVAFSRRNPDFFRMDFKIGVTVNSPKRKLAQSFFFDIQNLTNHKNVFAQRYNPVTNNINTAYQIGFFPNFVYRLQF